MLAGPSLLVPEDRYDVMPTYFIFGGVLFAPLTRDYLKSWGHEWWKAAPNELMTTYETAIRTAARQEVVILQKVLADEMNQGYHEYENHIVAKVDGNVIATLKHLVQIVEEGTGPYVTVELADGQKIVLDRKKSIERRDEILERFNVRHDRSKDLRPRTKGPRNLKSVKSVA
jgi:hypothetical protein